MRRKTILALSTFVLSFLILDRVFASKPSCTIYQPDRRLGQSLIPSRECREKTDEYDVLYKVNSMGLRDYEMSLAKEEGIKRILFLGDSFTQGIGVGLEETMAKKLEEILNDRPDGQFETINGGIAASAPAHQLAFLTSVGISFNPDLAIINLNSADFLEEVNTARYSLQYEDGRMVFNTGKKHYLPKFLEQYLKNNSFFYQQLFKNRQKFWKLLGHPDYVDSGVDAKPGDPAHDLFAITREIGDREFEELFGPVTARISQINYFLKDRNIPLLMVFIPHGHQVSPSQWISGRMVYQLTENEYPTRLNLRLAEFAKSKDIDFLDLSEKFKDDLARNPDHKIFYDYDGHLTALGNRLAAEAIYEYMFAGQLLVGVN